jgi:hypothetical protein
MNLGSPIRHYKNRPTAGMAEQCARRHNDCVVAHKDDNLGANLMSVAKTNPVFGRRHDVDEHIHSLLLHTKCRNLTGIHRK